MLKFLILPILFISISASATTATLDPAKFQKEDAVQFEGSLSGWMNKAKKGLSSIAKEALESPLFMVAKQVSALAPIFRLDPNEKFNLDIESKKSVLQTEANDAQKTIDAFLNNPGSVSNKLLNEAFLTIEAAKKQGIAPQQEQDQNTQESTLQTAHQNVPGVISFTDGANCARAGCPCDSYNGQAGEYCSRTCRDGTPCSHKRHTWYSPQNQPSATAASAATNVNTYQPPQQPNILLTSDFLRRVQDHEIHSNPYRRLYRNLTPQNQQMTQNQPSHQSATLIAPCACLGCPCDSYNGQTGEYCSRTCRNGTPCSYKKHTSYSPQNQPSPTAASAVQPQNFPPQPSTSGIGNNAAISATAASAATNVNTYQPPQQPNILLTSDFLRRVQDHEIHSNPYRRLYRNLTPQNQQMTQNQPSPTAASAVQPQNFPFQPSTSALANVNTYQPPQQPNTLLTSDFLRRVQDHEIHSNPYRRLYRNLTPQNQQMTQNQPIHLGYTPPPPPPASAATQIQQQSQQNEESEEIENCCIVCMRKACDTKISPCEHSVCCWDCATQLYASGFKCPSCNQKITAVSELEDDICIVCMDIKCDTMLLPCKHKKFCEACASQLCHSQHVQNKCPICREKITGMEKL